MDICSCAKEQSAYAKKLQDDQLKENAWSKKCLLWIMIFIIKNGQELFSKL